MCAVYQFVVDKETFISFHLVFTALLLKRCASFEILMRGLFILLEIL